MHKILVYLDNDNCLPKIFLLACMQSRYTVNAQYIRFNPFGNLDPNVE